MWMWPDTMDMSQASERVAHLGVEAIGGIDAADIDIRPGVTVLVGRNATNRTSLLQSITAACGSTDVSVRGDADSGEVQLRVDGETYTRTVRDGEDGVSASGEALLSEPRTAELFAFLLEANPVRRAVARGDPLRELILEPIDTESIEAEIARLREEKRELDAELETVGELRERLPELEARRERLDAKLERKRGELKEKQSELAAASERLEAERERSSELDEKLAELNEKRKTLAEVRSDLDIERSAIEEIRAEIADLEDERADLEDAPVARIEELDRQLAFVRDQKRDAEASMNDLQRIIQFNEEMIDGANLDLVEEEVADGDGPEAVTDRLVEGEQVVCWTCGTEVGKAAVESTVARLREVRQEELQKVDRLDDHLDELESERAKLKRQRDRAETIDRQLESLRSELAESRERVGTLESRAEALADEVDDIEQDVERLQDQTYDGLLDRQEAVDELEFEVERLREERETVDAEIRRTEKRVDERADLEAERDAVQEEVVELRRRVKRTESEAVEQFNERMAELLDRLGYDNIERIWVEPREPRGDGDGTDRVFDLHVVRTAPDGTTYEDTVDHLSESEREVTGIVFALAGYLAHDVYEDVPFLLLDSLEAIDSERIAALVEYVSDDAEYVVAALLPEDAQALDDDYDRVTDI
jgi:DNA repair exonuclease SbcCD ATPase subunit